jgi:quercetin dioxygenase-like cupin family protein
MRATENAREETAMETWDVRSLEIEVHQPQVLRSDEENRAIAILLPAGEELQEHQVHERAYLFVADGEIEISADGRKVTGGAGLVTHFEPAERHAVRAVSDARLVLVLSPWPGVGHPSRQD